MDKSGRPEFNSPRWQTFFWALPNRMNIGVLLVVYTKCDEERSSEYAISVGTARSAPFCVVMSSNLLVVKISLLILEKLEKYELSFSNINYH